MAPFEDLQALGMRSTYRTRRVLAVIARHPGSSNREVADAAGVLEDGQMSHLLKRLEGRGLVENRREGHAKGNSNAWWLTAGGREVAGA